MHTCKLCKSAPTITDDNALCGVCLTAEVLAAANGAPQFNLMLSLIDHVKEDVK